MNRDDIIRWATQCKMPYDYVTGEIVQIEKLEAFAALVAAAERNKLAAWMIQFGFATGHGDTMEQLVDALGSEIVDRIELEIDVAVAAEREACAKVCEDLESVSPEEDNPAPWHIAAAIRARGNT